MKGRKECRTFHGELHANSRSAMFEKDTKTSHMRNFLLNDG